MFYVIGQHRQAMIDERVKKALKDRKNPTQYIDMVKIEKLVDNDIQKGKTIKLSSYYDSPHPAIQASDLAKKDGAKKVSIQYFYFVGVGKKQKRKTGIYTSEAQFKKDHNEEFNLIEAY